MTSSKQQTIRTFRRLLPGGALVVIGSFLALSGGGVLAAFGTDGSLASGPHLLSTPTSAIVSPVTSIKHTSGVASVAGQPTLRLSASPVQGTAGVFVASRTVCVSSDPAAAICVNGRDSGADRHRGGG